MTVPPASPPASTLPAVARPASTALLVRTAHEGGRQHLEVFMVQRHRRSGFLANAWVFPGGRVDDADRMHGHARVTGKLALTGLSESGAAAYGVAAVRETFEEAGIWLGNGSVPGDKREPLASGAVAFADLLDAANASVVLDRLRPWGWWITPVLEPKRFDTRFLVALASGEGTHDGRETVDARWVRPRDVLAAHDLAGFPLAPPTWWTLRELARFDAAEAVVDAAVPPTVPVLPVMVMEKSGFQLLLPGHPDHGAPPIDGMPDRISYDGKGWVAWSGDDALPALP